MGCRAAAAAMVSALLAGCATPVPTVDYRPLRADTDDASVPYQLTDLRLVIGLVPTGDKGPPVSLDPVTVHCVASVCRAGTSPDSPAVRLAMAVVPIPFAAVVYTIAPRRRGLVTTSLAPTYYPNSLRLQALAVEAKDHRLEVINAVGTIARGAASLAAKGGMSALTASATTADLALPIVIDLQRAKGALTDTIALDPIANPGWDLVTYFGDKGAPPKDLGFREREAVGTVHHAVVTSVCRPFHLRLVNSPVQLNFEATVADPDWLATVPFPPKGIVTFHSLCGADVQSQAVAEIGVDAIAAAFVSNVGAIAAAAR